MLDTVKSLDGISEDKHARQVGAISIVNQVLHIAAIGEAGAALLASNLGGINNPGKGVL